MSKILESDLLLKHPFNLLVSGGTGSGKSEWITRLIQERERLINTKFDRICYHYGIFTEKVLYFQKLGIETYAGMPTEEEYFKSTNLPTFLILDDLLIESDEKFLQALFTRATHHCNISTAFLTQNLYAPILKIPKLNSQYFCFMRNPSSQLQMRIFGSQVFPKDLKFFIESYNDATKAPFGFLFCDVHAQSPPILRLRTRIFDDPIIYTH